MSKRNYCIQFWEKGEEADWQSAFPGDFRKEKREEAGEMPAVTRI